jgi:hypothetical protein
MVGTTAGREDLRSRAGTRDAARDLASCSEFEAVGNERARLPQRRENRVNFREAGADVRKFWSDARSQHTPLFVLLL